MEKDPYKMSYGEVVVFLFQRFHFKNEEVPGVDPEETKVETKCWVEGSFSVAYAPGQFIHVVNTGEHRSSFRGHLLAPGATFHSTDFSTIARIMQYDTIGITKPIFSTTMRKPPKPLTEKPTRYINLKQKTNVS